MRYRSGFLVVFCIMLCLAGCGQEMFSPQAEIAVYAREDGSGTRAAFVDLFGLQQKQEDGTLLDRTSIEADITNNTSVVMMSIARNPAAIGYISLGSLNDQVKPLKIDGVAPTVKNIQAGAYPAYRAFYLAKKVETSSLLLEDFYAFLFSAHGQQEVEQSGYVPIEASEESYVSRWPRGRIVISGSSSVAPLMERLCEAYMQYNPYAQIEIQTNDSSTGLRNLQDGICDIAMSSRALTEEEQQTMQPQMIARDGIVVIVHHKNPLQGLTISQVRQIFSGEVVRWQDLREE